MDSVTDRSWRVSPLYFHYVARAIVAELVEKNRIAYNKLQCSPRRNVSAEAEASGVDSGVDLRSTVCVLSRSTN